MPLQPDTAVQMIAAYRTTHSHVDWVGLRVGSHLALYYIHQMNCVNSCNDCYDDRTINIVPS